MNRKGETEMRVDVFHWTGRQYEVKPITERVSELSGMGVVVEVNHTERVTITSDDPVFLEELEGAVRAARLALEARAEKAVA